MTTKILLYFDWYKWLWCKLILHSYFYFADIEKIWSSNNARNDVLGTVGPVTISEQSLLHLRGYLSDEVYNIGFAGCLKQFVSNI